MNNEGAGYGLFQFGGASDWANNFIHHNVSINDGRKNSQAGFFIWCDPYNKSIPLRDSYICSNIVLSCYGHAVSFETGYAKNIVFEDNVFRLKNEATEYLGGDDTRENQSVVFDKNYFWCEKAARQGTLQPIVKRDKNAVNSNINIDMPLYIDVPQIGDLIDAFWEKHKNMKSF